MGQQQACAGEEGPAAGGLVEVGQPDGEKNECPRVNTDNKHYSEDERDNMKQR